MQFHWTPSTSDQDTFFYAERNWHRLDTPVLQSCWVVELFQKKSAESCGSHFQSPFEISISRSLKLLTCSAESDSFHESRGRGNTYHTQIHPTVVIPYITMRKKIETVQFPAPICWCTYTYTAYTWTAHLEVDLKKSSKLIVWSGIWSISRLLAYQKMWFFNSYISVPEGKI